jgi:hypothetical protein
MTRITREQMVEESVKILIRAALTGRGYSENTGDTKGWRMIDSYPYGLQKLDTNLVAAGFDFDDGGRQFEIGSNLKERKYTFEFFVFGTSLTWAKSLANAVKFSIEEDQAVPLYDITVTPDPTLTGEWLELDAVHSRREPIPEPEPWQEFVWTVTCSLTDWYTPALT